MKFVFFSVSENGQNGLSDEGAEGQCSLEFLSQNRPGCISTIVQLVCHVSDAVIS